MTSDPRTMDAHLQGNAHLHHRFKGGATRGSRPGDDEALQSLSQEEQECLQFFEKTIDSLEESLEENDRRKAPASSSRPVRTADRPPTLHPIVSSLLARHPSPKDQDIIYLVRPEPDLVQTKETTFSPTNPDFQSMMQNPESHFEIKARRDSLHSEYNPPLPSGSYGPTDSPSSYHPPGSIPTPVLIAQQIAENQAGGNSNFNSSPFLRSCSHESDKSLSPTGDLVKHGPPTTAKPTRFPANISMYLSNKEHQTQSLANVSIQERRAQMLSNLTGTSNSLLQEDPKAAMGQRARNIPTRSISFKDPSPEKSRMEALSKLGLNRNRALSGEMSLLAIPTSTYASPFTDKETSTKPLEASASPTRETSATHLEASASPTRETSATHLEASASPTRETSATHLEASASPTTKTSTTHLEASASPTTKTSATHLEASASPTTKTSTTHLEASASPTTETSTKPLEASASPTTKTSIKPLEASASPTTKTSIKPLEASASPTTKNSTKPLEASASPTTKTSIKPLEASASPTTKTSIKPLEASASPTTKTSTKPLEASASPTTKTSTKPLEASASPTTETSTKPLEASVSPTTKNSDKLPEVNVTSQHQNQMHVDGKTEVLQTDSHKRYEERNYLPSPSSPAVTRSSNYPAPSEDNASSPPLPEVTSLELNSYGGKSIIVNPSISSKNESIAPISHEPKVLPSALTNPSEFNTYGGKTKVMSTAHVTRSHLPDILSSHIDKSQTSPTKSELLPTELNSYGGKSRTFNPSTGLNHPPVTITRSAKPPAPTPAPRPPRHSYHGVPKKPVAPPEHRHRSSMFRPQGITVQFSGKGATDESRREALRKLGLLKDS